MKLFKESASNFVRHLALPARRGAYKLLTIALMLEMLPTWQKNVDIDDLSRNIETSRTEINIAGVGASLKRK